MLKIKNVKDNFSLETFAVKLVFSLYNLILQ
jgi:hypothetical protein